MILFFFFFLNEPKLLEHFLFRDFLKGVKNGSHYRASEVIPLIFGVFKNKTERWGGQNENNRPINLPKVITFSTDYNKYTTSP